MEPAPNELLNKILMLTDHSTFPLLDPITMWKGHVMHILKSAYSEKPSSAFMTPESFMFHMAGLSEESVLMLWDCVRNTVIDYSMVEDAYQYARCSLKLMVAVYVSYVGKDSAIMNMPLNWVNSNDEFVSATKTRFSIASHIQALVFWIGPEDFSYDLKEAITMFYAYDTGIMMGLRIANVNTMLNIMWTGEHFKHCLETFSRSEVERFVVEFSFMRAFKRSNSLSYEVDDSIELKRSTILHKVHTLFELEKAAQANEMKNQKRLKAKREKDEKEKAAKEKAELEIQKQQQELWANEKKERKQKKRLYREKKLATAKLEEAQRQQEIEAHLCLRLERYNEKIKEEQETRKILREKLSQPHVLSPPRKREEKIRRLRRQDDTHAVWREQKRKHRKPRK